MSKETAKRRTAHKELPESTKRLIEEMAASYRPRPKDRIPKVLDALKELWLMQPDTRLGQLLLNNVFRSGDYHDKTNQEMYNQEDTESLDNLLEALKKALQAKNIKNRTKKKE